MSKRSLLNVSSKAASRAAMKGYYESDRKVQPLRAGRGQRTSLPNEIVDSSRLVVDDSGGDDSDYEGSAENSVVEGPVNKKVKKAMKEGIFKGDIAAPALSTLPSTSALVPSLESSFEDTMTEDHEATVNSPHVTGIGILKPLELTFNLADNHKGPVHVNIDFSKLIVPTSRQMAFEMTGKTDPAILLGLDSAHYNSIVGTTFGTVSTSKRSESADTTILGTGFNDLPAELRIRIYRLTFRGSTLNTTARVGFPRSAAFLRTCKRVYEEGRTVLYGENVFQFRRELNQRGNFWDAKWNEIGYEDVHRFFDMIGPVNISLLRNIGLSFEDAVPSLSPHLSPNLRRFVNDEHLRFTLQLLAKHGRLEKLKLEILGRRRLDYFDYEFLHVVKKVKTNMLSFGLLSEDKASYVGFHRLKQLAPGKNIGREVLEELERAMVRKPAHLTQVARNRSPQHARPLPYTRPHYRW